MELNLDYKTILGIASVAITLSNHCYYLALTYLKRIRPHVFTQLIYFIVTVSVSIGMFAEGDEAAALRMVISAPLYIFMIILALQRGIEYIKRIDMVMLGLSLMAMPLWWLTDDPRTTILFLALVEGFAIIPAFRKAYELPFDDSMISPMISAISMLLALAAVSDPFASWATAIYLAYWTLLCSALALLIVWRRYVVGKQSTT